MKYLNSKLWKSAYLIEFYRNNILEEAYTFSVPPQNEEFTFPQRINETKTFGGSVFDDYGNDTVKISLSGTTINQELKLIYRSNKGIKYLTGKDEIFYLRDLLKKYGRLNNLENKEVYLYALENGKKGGATGNNPKAWQIYTSELQIKRSKDMPFTYFYSLSCTGIPIDVAAKNKILAKLSNNKFFSNIFEGYSKFVDTFTTGLDFVSTYLGYIDDFANLFSIASNKVSEVGALFESYAGLVSGSVDSVTGIVAESVGLLDNTFKTTLKLTPQNLTIQLFNSVGELFDACNDMKKWWENFVVQVDPTSNESEFNKLANSINVSGQELSDKFKKVFLNLSNEAAILSSETQKEVSSNSTEIITAPGSNEENDSVVICNGYKEYAFKSGDTWAKLSQDFYGTPNYATIIQSYNSDISLDILDAGSVIYIPNITGQSDNSISLNAIYNDPSVKDIYGKDIEIGLDGDFAFKKNETGDFELINGVNNLNQAMLNRLSSSINSRVRNIVYGIRNETGNSSVDSEAIASYITTSIEQTILADPRIESVEEMTWQSIGGENIQINVTYKTITGNIGVYSTAV